MIYKVERIKEADYDEVQAFVVRAPNPQHARQLAASNAKDEGRNAWTEELTRVTPLTGGGKPEIILRDYNAG